MKPNNKISRAKQRQEIIVQQDGTEVLHTKESRRKLRRWTFEAIVTIADRLTRLSVDAIAYGDAKAARADARDHEERLKSLNETLRNNTVKVICIPHETCSQSTINQISGYRDMAAILDHALEMSVQMMKDITIGRSLGAGVVELEMKEAKEALYQRAIDDIKSRQSNHAKVSLSEEALVEEQAEIQRPPQNENLSGIVLEA